MKPLKVLLIWPDLKNPVVYDIAKEKDEEFGYKPPLGLLSIATYVNENSQHKAKVIDCCAQKISKDSLIPILNELQPDVVGTSIWTELLYSAMDLLTTIKSILPDTMTIVGGPHVWLYPKETLNHENVDFICIGDGEKPFLKLLDHLSANQPIQTGIINGIYPSGIPDSTIFTNYIEKNLDDLPFPDRTLLPIHLYSGLLNRKRFSTTMITSRGCPFQCVYCKMLSQKSVLRSAENVVKEIKAFVNLGIQEFEIYDDTFSTDPKRVIKICELIIEQKLDVTWAARDRVTTVREELLPLMKAAGCKRINIGVESGSQRILNRIRKNIKIEEIKNAFRLTRQYGIETVAFFMIGLPNETLEDINKTIKLAIELDPDYASFAICKPYPGTQMYQMGIEQGLFDDFWKQFSKKPIPNFQGRFWNENFTDAELFNLKMKAQKKFYLRPKYMGRQLLSQNVFSLLKRMKVGYGLIKQKYERKII